MNRSDAMALRRWIREVNRLGEQYGHEDMAGTPDYPDPDYVDRFKSGETPAQVIAADFGQQEPSHDNQ